MAEVGGTNLDKALGGHQKDEFIQVWRGIASFIVIYYHFSNRVAHEALNSAVPPTIEFFTGKLGVMVFFIISGYLITQSLASSKNLASFYAKRVSRIWPLFIVASLTIFVAMQFLEPPQVLSGPKQFHEGSTDIVNLIGNLFFLEDLGFKWVDGVFWSILVELKFYLIIGLLAYLFPRNFVVIFSIGAFVFGSIEMLIRVNHIEDLRTIAWLMNGILIAQHAPFFAIGALMLTNRHRELLTLNILLACCEIAYKVAENPDFSVYGTIEFTMVLSAIIAFDALFLKRRLLLAIGDYSYSWYLFHQLIGLSLIRMWTPQIGIDLAILAALVVTFGICWCGSWVAEWRLRHLFFNGMMKAFQLVRLDRATIDGAAVKSTIS